MSPCDDRMPRYTQARSEKGCWAALRGEFQAWMAESKPGAAGAITRQSAVAAPGTPICGTSRGVEYPGEETPYAG